jgi:MerR family transcriptional regulator, mercuric resistance operon regulatory protein
LDEDCYYATCTNYSFKDEIVVSPAMHQTYSIGDLARRAECRVETVRYYERKGLMPNPQRSEGGHRLYLTEQLKRLMFIRHARELGFTLDQICGLLDLADSGNFTCAEVKEMTLNHREDVKRKIANLKRLDCALSALADSCDGDSSQDCAIFDALFEARGEPIVR